MIALGYYVDFVFCIDGTVTMAPHLDRVKQTAKSMVTDMQKQLERRGSTVAQIRARIILFRDYLADGEHAMLLTDFFELSQQIQTFESCLESIDAGGGGDEPEDGLEALAYAITSNWTENHGRKRHVIVVWSDAGTHELGHGRSSQHYPKGMARDIRELQAWWDSKSEQYFGVLVLFAPDENHWDHISQNWDNVIHYPSAAGEGLDEGAYRDILSTIYDPS